MSDVPLSRPVTGIIVLVLLVVAVLAIVAYELAA
jgi:hypothetical protein